MSSDRDIYRCAKLLIDRYGDDGALDRRKARALLRDAAELAGVKRRRVLLDTVRAKEGRRFMRELLRAKRLRPRHALDGVL